MSRTLTTSIGVPIVTIYTSNKKPILGFGTDGNELSHEIVDFKYTYDEEGDDVCNITFETTDPYFPDMPFFNKDTILLVQWGFIGGQYMRTAKVIVRDTETDYGNDSIRVVVKTTDLISAFRAKQGAISTSDTMISYLNDKFTKDGLSYEVIQEGKIMYTDGKAPYKTNEVTGNTVTAIDKTAVARYWETPSIITLAGNSSLAALKNVLDEAPGGPWHMSGRGSKLTIYTRNFNQRPITDYKYAGIASDNSEGDLISFIPRTEYKKTEIEELIAEQYEPEEKKHKTHLISGGDISGNKTKSDLPYTDDERGKLVGYMKKLAATIDHNREHPEDPWELPDQFVLYNTESPATFSPETGYWSTAIDETRTQMKTVTPARVILSMPGSADILRDALGNAAKAKEEKKQTATAKIIGDPRLITGKTILVTGVAQKYAGIYLLNKLTHSITKGTGYFVEVEEALRKPDPVTVTQTSTDTQAVLNDETLSVLNKDVNKAVKDWFILKKRSTELNTNERKAEEDKKKTNFINNLPNLPKIP